MAKVYCLYRIDTGKKYIGSTRKDIKRRIDMHYSHVKILNNKLYKDMQQYSFLYGIIEDDIPEEKRYERALLDREI